MDSGARSPGKQGKEAERNPKWLQSISFPSVVSTCSSNVIKNLLCLDLDSKTNIEKLSLLKVHPLSCVQGHLSEIAEGSTLIGI